MSSNNEKIEASIMLGSYFDTIGFFNGDFEFNYGHKINNIKTASFYWLDIIHNYYALGGSKMNITKLNASDDTLLMLATGNACLKGGGVDNYVKSYLDIYEELKNEKRSSGMTTLNSLEEVRKLNRVSKINIDKLNVIKNMGGNGAAIRTSIIGLVWHNDIDKLIEESIIASKITHRIELGYLSGMITALFTAYAYNGIEPWLWCNKLLELYESGKFDKYLSKDSDYFKFWYKYKEERLDRIKLRNSKKFIFPHERLIELADYNHAYTGKDIKNMEFNNLFLGSTGLDALIWAYDSLLLSLVPNEDKIIDLKKMEFSVDSLIFFSCINVGDSDSIGIICGSWYGALMGYTDFDKNKMKELEFYNKLKNLSKKLSN